MRLRANALICICVYVARYENAWDRRFVVRTYLDKDLPLLQGRDWRLADVQIFHGAFSILDQDRPHVRRAHPLLWCKPESR